MTGFAKGKILLPAKVFLDQKEVNASVFIHVKGYALARVTHLDIEGRTLDFKRKNRGIFCTLKGTKGGMEIELENFGIGKIIINCDLLNSLLKPKEKTRAFLGFKEGGIFIGFRKKYIERLERIAKEVEPELFEQKNI